MITYDLSGKTALVTGINSQFTPAAAYVHGAILPVDGGWLAR